MEMEREELTRVIKGFFEAMNDHDVETMGGYCAEGVVADEVAEPETFDGVHHFKKSYSGLFQGYPDCTAEVEQWVVDGDAVVCQVRWRGTNSGVFRGSEPTGKKVDVRIAYFFNLKDGKIDRITEYYDVATIMAQQGQLEP
jgi:steroid delta-isomerase-like uncharacterized protein